MANFCAFRNNRLKKDDYGSLSASHCLLSAGNILGITLSVLLRSVFPTTGGLLFRPLTEPLQIDAGRSAVTLAYSLNQAGTLECAQKLTSLFLATA